MYKTCLNQYSVIFIQLLLYLENLLETYSALIIYVRIRRFDTSKSETETQILVAWTWQR